MIMVMMMYRYLFPANTLAITPKFYLGSFLFSRLNTQKHLKAPNTDSVKQCKGTVTE